MSGLGSLTAYPNQASVFGGLLPLLIGMGVVVLVLGGVLWLVRRRFGPTGPSKIDCSMVGALAVGPRERLVVVRIEGKRLLLGVTGSAIGLLCELPANPVPPPDQLADRRQRPPAGQLRQRCGTGLRAVARIQNVE